MLTLSDVAAVLTLGDDNERVASEFGLSWPEIHDAAIIAATRQEIDPVDDTEVRAFVNGFLTGIYIALAWRRKRNHDDEA